MSTFKIIMCCVDERAGGFVLEEGTREDIVKEERKRTKLKRLSRGVWVRDRVRWLKRSYNLIACEQVLHLGEAREVTDTLRQRLHT